MPAPFPKQRSAGDKSSNQLPLLPFNSKNGPLNWILSALTHILRATIFMLPIQNVPVLSCHVNHAVGTDSPHYILTNSLNISRREHDIRSKVFIFSLQKAPNLRGPSGTSVTTWAGILKKPQKTEALTVTVSSELLKALLLSGRAILISQKELYVSRNNRCD